MITRQMNTLSKHLKQNMWTIMRSTQLQSFRIDAGFPAVELWSMQIYAFGEGASHTVLKL